MPHSTPKDYGDANATILSADPKQIVCTGSVFEPGKWNPAFGEWESDRFGIDSDKAVGTAERLYVRRDLYDHQVTENARLRAALKWVEESSGCQASRGIAAAALKGTDT